VHNPGHFSIEAAALGRRLGLFGPSWARAWGMHALLILLFGIFLPYRKGLDFFDPAILGVYACLVAVFAAPAAAVGPVASMAAARARIAVCVAYGELMALAMTASGIATVYLSHRNGLFFPPALDALLETAALGLLFTWAFSAVAVWISARWSPGIAKWLIRVIFLGLLVWFFLRGRFPVIGFVWLNHASPLAV